MKTTIKVLHIISSLGQGGAERQLVELIKKNKNHAICQLMSGGEYEKYVKSNNLPLYDLGLKKSILDIFKLYRLYIIIKKFKPDVIHTWMYHASLIEVILRKIIKNNHIPLVWGMRCSDMDTSHYSKQLKIVIKACNYFSNSPNIIVNNSKIGGNFHKSIGFKSKHITISNGIDTNLFKPNEEFKLNFRRQLNIEIDTKVLLCVARHDAMKDHVTLINSFTKLRKLYPETILILAGTGTENINDNEGIIKLGACSNIEEVYSSSDIIISSSAFGEGFSNAIGEGMSSGLIPIATNVGDAEFIIGNTGLIVEPRDENNLLIAMKSILELENKIFLNKKLEARKRICEYFSKDLMLDAYNKLYTNLVLKE